MLGSGNAFGIHLLIGSQGEGIPSSNSVGNTDANVNSDFVPSSSYGSQVGNVLTVIAVLAIIIVLIVLLIRFLGRRNQTLSRNRSIRTLGAVGLGPNKSLQVLEIGGSIYLVGVGDDITLLDKISDAAEAERLLESFEQEVSDFSKLSNVVSGIASRFRKEPPPLEEELDETAFHEVFESKLRKLPNRKEQVKEILQENESTDRLRDS